MADDLNAVARLTFLAEGAREASRQIENVKEAGGDLGREFDKIQKTFEGVAKEATALATGLKRAGSSAKDSGSDAKGAATGWSALEEKIKAVREASREAAQTNYLKSYGDNAFPDKPVQNMSGDEQRAFLAAVEASQASAVSIARQAESERQAIAEKAAAQNARINDVAAQRWIDAEEAKEAQARRVADVAAQHWINAEERKEAQSRRAADVAAQQWIDAEERKAAQIARINDVAAKRWMEAEERRMKMAEANARRLVTLNATNARNSTGARAGSVFDQGQTYDDGPPLKAADTSWAKDYNDRVTQLAEQSSPRLRYALYDVATTAGIMSAAITASGVAAVAAGASFESSFTNVERTLDGSTATGLAQIREELVGLTREIPLAFSDVSEIATLGNQLGITSSDVGMFTETVAKFATVTGMTVDAAATAFGSLGELLRNGDGTDLSATQYESLGSAIAYVGRRSVATEAEIVAMSTRLASSATSAGFTAQQVVALSGAFASLRIAPERAQGVMEVYFKRLNTAIAEGGDSLAAWSNITGLAGDQIAEMVSTDAVGFFGLLAEKIGRLDSVAQTTALADLGLDGIRAGEVFGRVSSNLDVFTQALGDSDQAWAASTELTDQYAKVLDDLATKWSILQNAIMEAAAGIGAALAPVVGPILDVVTRIAQGFADLAKTSGGRWFVGIAAGAAAVVGLLAAVVAGGAMLIASLAAVKFSLVELGFIAVGATTGVRGLAAAMFGMGQTVGVSAGMLNGFKVALASTGIGLAVIALGTLAAAFMATGNSAEDAFNKFIGTTGGLSDALAADAAARAQAVATGNQALADSYVAITPVVEENTEAVDENQQQISNTATVLGMIGPGFDSANDALATNTQYLGQNTTAWAKNQLMQNEAFREMAGNQEFTDYWTAIAADMDTVIRLSAEGGEDAVLDYFRRLEAAALAGGAAFESAFAGSTGILQAGWGSGRGDAIGQGANLFGTTPGKSINDLVGLTGGLTGQISLLGLAAEDAGGALTTGADNADDAYTGLNDTLGGTGGTIEQVRTLVDYANDLGSVMTRAFNIEFGPQIAMDQITLKWLDIADANAEAADQVAEYKRRLKSLNADKATLEFQLKVAKDYGDTEQVGELQADLADVDAKRADTQRDLGKAQDKTNKTLTGNSRAAIENRATLNGLVQSHQAHIEALAASGASQEEINAAIEQGKQDFIDQAVAMGYNRDEVNKFAGAFDAMGEIVKGIDRNVSVEFDGSAALTAIEEFKRKAAEAGRNAGSGFSGGFNNGARGIKLPKIETKEVGVAAGVNMGKALGFEAKKQTVAYLNSIKFNGKGEWAPGGKIGGAVGFKFFRSGGYTGGGGAGDVAGLVHGQEFVFSAPATRSIGLNNLTHMHEMAKRGKSFAPSGGGSGFASLDAGSIDMLARRIAYYSKDLVIAPDALRGAVGASTAFANAQGRG